MRACELVSMEAPSNNYLNLKPSKTACQRWSAWCMVMDRKATKTRKVKRNIQTEKGEKKKAKNYPIPLSGSEIDSLSLTNKCKML